jgi:hypothetical protein
MDASIPLSAALLVPSPVEASTEESMSGDVWAGGVEVQEAARSVAAPTARPTGTKWRSASIR